MEEETAAGSADAMESLPVIVRPKFLAALPANSAAATDADPPIFSKRKMQLRIPDTCAGNLIHLTVSKNWLVCLLATEAKTTFLRFFLRRAIPPGEIALEKYLAGYRISKVFLDPTGHHLLISLVPLSPGLSADFLYIHGNGPRVRRIEKFKDHEITAVAFNSYNGTESSTGAILLGTNRGLIFETELTQDVDKPSYRKQVYDLGLGLPKYPITGLEVLRVPNTNKCVVVATAPDCMYTFQETLRPEEKSLQSIFAGYVNGTLVHGAEEVKTDLSYSVLRFFAQPNVKYPTQYGWLCGAGIRAGQVSSDGGDEKILMGDSLISLDFDQHKHLSYEERRQNLPKSFVLSEHHALLLYPDHVTGICLLSQEVVYEEYFHEKLGKLLNIVRDSFTGDLYVYTDKTIFNYKITDERRNIWKIYLEKGMYDMAEVYAVENPENLATVMARKAEAAFEAKNYKEAAMIYAETDEPFEAICLKFMILEDKMPIISYVKKRLTKIDDSPQHVSVLVIWLVDLYLTQINLPGRTVSERQRWQTEFDEFMENDLVSQSARENREVIHDLMTQHADSHNISKFAISMGEYEEVIKQYLSAEKYREALEILRTQRNPEFFYNYCPELIDHLPTETVDLLIAQARNLDVKRLVPTLLNTDTPKHVHEVMKYLEYVIYNLGETNEAIHNYLLRLYAENKPAKVMSYLENEGFDDSLVHYDINYALKTCLDNDAKVACVFLYALLGLWSKAVALALTFDVKLAKDTASKPQDEEIRRTLWLDIAYHDIAGTDDVKKALALLKECELLRIEDSLPFFSDFEKIDDFKEPICDALQDYNQKIQELQHEKEESSKQARRVCEDLQNVRERSIRIESHAICSICETYLLLKPFFLFACGHKFHSDCLEKQVLPFLTTEQCRQLNILKQQLETLLTQSAAMAEHSRATQKDRDKIKKEIEEILASDCLYCGLMIETIDLPFVEDWDQVNVDWE